jgi:hypothetical protein
VYRARLTDIFGSSGPCTRGGVIWLTVVAALISRPILFIARPRDADGAIGSGVFPCGDCAHNYLPVALCVEKKWGGLLPFFLGLGVFYVLWKKITNPRTKSATKSAYGLMGLPHAGVGATPQVRLRLWRAGLGVRGLAIPAMGLVLKLLRKSGRQR